MENIRVLVKTSDFGSAFHETLEMKADCDLSVISGPYEARQTTVVPAGEILTIGKDSELFAGDASALSLRCSPGISAF